MQDDLRVSTIILPLNQPTASCPVETVSTVDVVMKYIWLLPRGRAFVVQTSFQLTLSFSWCDACINIFKCMM